MHTTPPNRGRDDEWGGRWVDGREYVEGLTVKMDGGCEYLHRGSACCGAPGSAGGEFVY